MRIGLRVNKSLFTDKGLSELLSETKGGKMAKHDIFHVAKDKDGKVRVYLTKIIAKEEEELTGDEIPLGDILELEKSENKFLQAIFDFFKDPDEPGKISIYKHHNKLGALDGFPKGLDLENCELKGVEPEKIWFAAGGDWQDPVNFAVILKNGKLVVTGAFESDYNVPHNNDIAAWKKNVEAAGSLKKSLGETTIGWEDIEKSFWNIRGKDSIDVSEINPADLKFDLIKDPKKRAKFEIDLKKEEIKNNQRLEEGRYEVLFKDRQLLEETQKRLPGYKRDMDTAEAAMRDARKDREEARKNLEKLKKENAPAGRIRDAEDALNSAKWSLETAASEFRNERRAYKEAKDRADAITAKFQKQGIKPEKMDAVLKDIAADIARMRKEVDELNSQFEFYVREAQKKLEAAKATVPPLADQIKHNVRSIMDDLKPMEIVKKEILKQREQAAAGLKKSFVILNNRLYLKVS